MPVGWVTAVAVAATLLAGCAPDAGPQSSESQGSGPQGSGRVAGASQSTDEAVRTLAAAGVATVADESATSPLVPVSDRVALTVTKFQAGVFAAETVAHAGILGADLDEALPLPQGVPPVAFLIGAWADQGADATAQAASRLLGKPDWQHAEQVVFPTETLALFVADALAHAGQPATGAATPASTGSGSDPGSTSSDSTAAAIGTGSLSGVVSGPVVAPAVALTRPLRPLSAAAPVAVSGPLAAVPKGPEVLAHPCSAVAGFVDETLNAIFNALKLDPAVVADFVSGKLGGGVVGAVVGTVAGFFASFWNRALDFARGVIEAGLHALIAPALNALTAVLGGVATVTIIASYLKKWTTPVTANPTSNRFAHGTEADLTGAVSMKLDPGQETEDWPEAIKDCAVQAKVTLPELAKPGAAVTWGFQPSSPGLVTPSPDVDTAVLDDNLSNTVSYTTGRESDEQYDQGHLLFENVTVTVHVERGELQDLVTVAEQFFLSAALPTWLQRPVRTLLAPIFDKIHHQIASILGVTGSANIDITHHLPPEPAPSARPSTAACVPDGKTIPAGHYSGPVNATLKSTMRLGPVSNAGSGTDVFTGTVVIDSNGSTVTGSVNLSGLGLSQVGPSGSTQVHSTDNSEFTGQIKGKAADPVVTGSFSGEWASLDAPVINGSGSDTRSVTAGLHITRADCTSVSGDAIAMFTDLAAPVAQYITISGSGIWTARRS